MSSKRMSVAQLAEEAGIDTDEALICLWDEGFSAVKGPHYVFPRREANRARRSLGLATRRELSSKEYWMKEFELSSESDLDVLLLTLGVHRPIQGKRLRSKAIHRLLAERKQRTSLRNKQKPFLKKRQRPYKPFQWTTIGHESDVILLTAPQVCAIHESLVEDFKNTADPLDPPGVRSMSLLESAISRPATGIGGHRKYPTIEMAAAALMYALVHDHPFHNGNKRTALVSMLVALDENGLVVTCPEDELFKLVLQLAQHALTNGPRAELPDREVLAVARWLETCVRRVVKGDRPLAWWRLKRILSSYSCTYENPSAGNKINIIRVKKAKRSGTLFRTTRRETLRTQIAYAGDGTEADRNTVNKIRNDLELDEEHGIDSAVFYDNRVTSQSEFIHRYKKTLRRLAKL